jgi:short-subunit dehydrogenase
MKKNRFIWAAGLAAGWWAWQEYRRSRSQTPLAALSARSLAVITGASAGIGAAYATQLAARGYNLLLVARRRERLRALATQLRRQYGIEVELAIVDLANPTQVTDFAESLRQRSDLAVLVNNAGFGTGEPFAAENISGQLDMVQVHIQSALALTHAALQPMLANQNGIIISVSSLAGWFAAPNSAVYAATKAFLNLFGKALSSELAESGIQVQVVCPGLTHTEFHDAAALQDGRWKRLPTWLWQSAEVVVRDSLAGLTSEEVIFIPGWHNRLLYWFSFCTPVIDFVLSPTKMAMVGRALARVRSSLKPSN